MKAGNARLQPKHTVSFKLQNGDATVASMLELNYLRVRIKLQPYVKTCSLPNGAAQPASQLSAVSL